MGELQEKLNKLKKMPFKLAAEKVINKTYDVTFHKGRKAYIKINPIDLKNSLFEKFIPNKEFLFDSKKKEFYIEKLEYLGITNQIKAHADKICSHQFDLLGSGVIKFDENIPWNVDFKAGYTWPNKYYKDIKVIDLNNKADVKVPWELSRFQHLFTIGKAYWITSDERYAEEFQKQANDWILKNPLEMSVNWTCTMDVAIRAVNWISAYYLFENSKKITKEFWIDFNKSLYLHGKFIYKNLENKADYTGNHYLSNIVGLIWLGLYFKGFKIGRGENIPERWLEFGCQELEKEMMIQVNADGTNYEASTSYHRLVTELFLLTTILCARNNISFSAEFKNTLIKMCEFAMDIMQPNGKSPLIGDADDGRLILFSNYYNWDRDDFRSLLSIAGEFFQRDDFRFLGLPFKEDALWAVGSWNKPNNAPTLKSASYKNGGYYILRNKTAYCCIRCGENSIKGVGVHSHNDQLSFVLNIEGESIFVDPGAYTYTADYKMRNLFRSTTMHNTLEIPGIEQNDYEEKKLFYLKEQTFAQSLVVKNNLFSGLHYGYLDKCGVIHKRTFEMASDRIVIKDKLDGTKDSIFFKLNFMLDPKVSVNIKDNKVEINGDRTNIHMIFNNHVNITLENSYTSINYGVKVKSKKIVIEHLGVELETSIIFG